ncbi:MAG: DoxX family protein [Nitrospira sp.]|nr:DoxX family protein [Nitrospira sp.]
MQFSESYLTLVGRILIGVIFVMSGINKILTPDATQQYMASHGLNTLTTALYVAAIVVEVGAGVCLLIGYQTRRASSLLLFFMIPATLLFHTNFADQNQMIHFLKNLSMSGGLLYVLTYGAGRISLDAWERTRRGFTAPTVRTG